MAWKLDWFDTSAPYVMLSFHSDSLTCWHKTETVSRCNTHIIYTHSVKPCKDYLSPVWFVSETNQVDKSTLSGTIYRDLGWRHRRKGERKKENYWNVLLLCAFSVQGQVISFPCSTLFPPANNSLYMTTNWLLTLTRSRERNELELVTDWQEDISSRMLFAGAFDLLFVIEWPQGSVSSPNSESSGFRIKRCSSH